MNKFYAQHKILLWAEAILLAAFGFYPALAIIEAGYSNPIIYLTFLVYLPFFNFTFTPFFKLTGIYHYYSPMLLGYMPNKVQIDLHSGGSFDYLFVMRKFKPGNEIRNKLLIYHLEGLLNIINSIDNNKIPSTVKLVGTSYFFNDRTVSKLGFELEKPSLFYRINLLVNFIDLIWMYSVARGRFAIPKLWDAKKATIVGSKLLLKRELIQALHTKMVARTQ